MDAKQPTEEAPPTPSIKTLSLTEYAANRSPPGGAQEGGKTSMVPLDFMLPSGHPDVS